MTYSNNPKIGIIGAGVSGLAFARALLVNGYSNICIFEKNNKLGGTWNPERSYPYQVTETPRGYYEYIEDPWPTIYAANTPASVDEVYAYLTAFAKKYDIEDKIRYLTEVKKIICHANEKIEIQVENQSDKKEEFVSLDFLIIAVAGIAGDPNIPKIPGNFTGKVVHSAYLNNELLQNINSKNLKTVIVGGNKSAFDIINIMHKHDIKNYVWLYRKMYWIMHYEHYLDFRMVETDYQNLSDAFITYLTNKLQWDQSCINLVKSSAINIDSDSTDLFYSFNNAICTLDHIEILKRANRFKKRIISASDTILKLDSNQIVSADVLIFATGFNHINLPIVSSNGQVLKNFNSIKSLYRTVVDPEYPKILFMPPYAHISIHAPQASYFVAKWTVEYIKKYLLGNIDIEKIRMEVKSDILKQEKIFGPTYLFQDVKGKPLQWELFGTGVKLYQDLGIDVTKLPFFAKTSKMIREIL